MACRSRLEPIGLCDWQATKKLMILQARKHFAQVYNNLMRRDLSGFVVYVERQPQLLSLLVAGYENADIALNCGTMLREVRRAAATN